MATKLALVLLLIGGVAHADTASDAQTMFDEGNRLMTAGKLAEACTAFEGSNRTDPRAGTLIRLGECREANHQLASALAAFEGAIARVKDERKRAVALAHVAALKPRVSHVTVVVRDAAPGETVSINGIAGTELAVDGGTVIIEVTAAGRATWHTTVTVPDEGAATRVEVPGLGVLAVAEPTHVDKPPSPPHADEPPPPPEHGVVTRRRTIALGFGGVAVVATVAAAIVGSTAKTKQHDAYALCPDPATPCMDAASANSLITSGRHRALAANLTFGLAGGAAIAATILWLTGAPVTPTANGVVVEGHF